VWSVVAVKVYCVCGGRKDSTTRIEEVCDFSSCLYGSANLEKR
jgi:hypothetical protein